LLQSKYPDGLIKRFGCRILVELTRFAGAFQASASLRAIVNDRRMSASIQERRRHRLTPPRRQHPVVVKVIVASTRLLNFYSALSVT